MIFSRDYILILKLSLFLGQYFITLSKASKTTRNATLTDLSKCKLTQFGTDYMGSVATTAGGIRCQMWHSEKPLHKVSETITDKDFPERSLQLARNYCRNPTKDPRGPWCYTMEPTLIDDACEVPLCNFGECRISGTGSEYGGTHDTASSGKKCKSWDKRLKLAVNKTEKLDNNKFSDLSRDKAKNFCRNPDGSTGGPWCWVDSDNYEIVEKEYCSVSFCDDKDCLVYTKNASVYSTLTSLNNDIGNITFWIKLWNPADEQIGQARLLFTNLQVPTSAEVIAQEWRAGVEIVISNSGSGQEYPQTDDEKDFEDTPNILLGSKWTALWVAWGGGFISVGHDGSTNPIFLDEFKKKNTISSMYPESFFQYGIMGTGVLWSMEFCEDACEVHTTFGLEFLRVWPLLQSNSSHDLQFHVRASHKAMIQLTQTPAVPFPCLWIVIGQHDSTLVMYQEKETSLKEILLDLKTKHILNFWAWSEFTISIFGMAIQMFWHRDYGREEVFSIEHHTVQTVRWFSIGSENTIAHWTIFCAPSEADAVEPPWFPNCISSSSDSRYEGSQWTTENQIPCIPWISDKIPEDYKKDDTFIEGSVLKALNKCRNPTNDPEGPFCYTAVQSGSTVVEKQYCPIRKCRSSECKMAGTANDYLGTLSVTRSGRTCARWVFLPEVGTAPKKNISLGTLMARALISLKVKRENTLRNSIFEITSRRWDEMGLRSRLPRQSLEDDDDDDGFDFFKQKPATFPPKISSKATPKSSPGNIQDPKNSATGSRPTDDDDDGFDFFKQKPATFPPKISSKTTPKSSPGNTQDPKNSLTSSRPTDDDDDGFDFFKQKPATFPPKKSSKATPKSSPENTQNPKNSVTSSRPTDDDDDGFDFFKQKPATFPPKKSSKSPFTSSTVGKATPESPNNDDNSPPKFQYPGTFEPYGVSKSTKSPDNNDDDDSFPPKFQYPGTFEPYGVTKSTKSPDNEDDDDNSPPKFQYPGTFEPYEVTKSTKSPDNNDDDDSFPPKFQYPGTFEPYGVTKSTKSPDDDDDDDNSPPNFQYPGTFEPYGVTKSTKSPDDDDDDDDDDNSPPNFQYPGTFEPYGVTKSTKSPDNDDDDDNSPPNFQYPGTFEPYGVTKSTKSPDNDDDDDNSPPKFQYPGTFEPYGVTKSTSKSHKNDDDDDNDDDDLFNLKPATFPPKKNTQATSKSSPGTTPHQEVSKTNSDSHGFSKSTSKSPGPRDLSTDNASSSSPLSSAGDTTKSPPSKKVSNTTPQPRSTVGGTTISDENNATTQIHKVDPKYLNDTLYPEQSAKKAHNYCRNPSRNVAGTWCYTTDPDVPQDLCNVRDCEQPEECTFLVRGHGTGRRLYVLPEYRSEGLHFSLKEWEPDHPDSITFVILSEDDVKSRFILKVGAMNNEKVLLYLETKAEGIKLVKQKTLPHLLYLGRWTGFVLHMGRGEIKLYYEDAPYPLFEWKHPEPEKAFLPIYYYYSSELGNSIGVAFKCNAKCHIEQTTTPHFTRILPISIWEPEETPSPNKLVLMLRGKGVIMLPLLLLPRQPGYYGLTIGEMGQWIFFLKNRLPNVHLFHKQDANGPLFTPDTWTNITIKFHNTTIQVYRNGTEVFHYIHNLPLLFYSFSISVDQGGWVTWAANCIPTDIDGDPLDGGWSEWGPWSCSASCNGGMGVRKRICDNPEPNIRGQPCLGPSISNGHCNMNKCGDVTDVTLALIKRRIRIEHKSMIIKEGDEAILSADADIVSALQNETSNSEINWSRNGIFLEEEEDRVKLEDAAASISYAVLNDSGVYTQTLNRVDDSHLVFKIISLAVIPTRSEFVIRETLPFSITCHCVVLGYVYSDLKVSWILNGKVFKDYGVSTPVAVNVDHIPKANTSHHGEWRCEVVQSDLNFKWTTNVIKVRVLGPPNWRTHLMEDKLTRPIFGWMPSEGFVAFSAFFLTVLIIVCIVMSTIWYLRFRKSLKYKDSKKREPTDNEESFDDSESEKLIARNKS